MDGKTVLMIVVLLLSLYLKMYWLAALLGVVAFFMIVTSIEISTPQPAPAGGKEEEILTPVVVQDVGEPPYLYPPNFDLKLKPREKIGPWFWVAAFAMGRAFRSGVKAVRGDKLARKKPSQWFPKP